MKIILAILMFLVLGALLIISNNNIQIFSNNGSKEFLTLFLSWIENSSENVWKISGEIVRSDFFS